MEHLGSPRSIRDHRPLQEAVTTLATEEALPTPEPFAPPEVEATAPATHGLMRLLLLGAVFGVVVLALDLGGWAGLPILLVAGMIVRVGVLFAGFTLIALGVLYAAAGRGWADVRLFLGVGGFAVALAIASWWSLYLVLG